MIIYLLGEFWFSRMLQYNSEYILTDLLIMDLGVAGCVSGP
jgi:hypothetical protein